MLKLKNVLISMAMLSIMLSGCSNDKVENNQNSKNPQNLVDDSKTEITDGTSDEKVETPSNADTSKNSKREDILKNPLLKVGYNEVELKGSSENTITKINEEYMKRDLTEDEIQTSLDKTTKSCINAWIYSSVGKAEGEVLEKFPKSLNAMWEDGKTALPKDINDDLENDNLTKFSTKYFSNDTSNLTDFLGLQRLGCVLDSDYILEGTTKEGIFEFILNLTKDGQVVAVVSGEYDKSTETFTFRGLKRTLYGDKFYENEAKKAPNQQES